MKNNISLILIAVILISTLSILSSCDKPKFLDAPTINGTSLEEYTIVYDEDGLDYNQRAAEHIKDTVKNRYNLDIPIIDDDSNKVAHEIVVGETSRDISISLDAKVEGLQFAILASEGSIALEGNYFVIAAAAYFFTETYANSDGDSVTVPETISIHDPIVKKAKNFIMLIGDGMGVYQTLMLDYMENNIDYSDGEDIFYGYMLPYMGESKTDSLSGTTDSAAGGTALSCGVKTYNKYIGKDKDLNDIKSLTELADELGKDAVVMSTEFDTGATPSSFAAHASNRNSTADLMDSLINATLNYGTVIDCGYNYYTPSQLELLEDHIETNLNNAASNENGFFFMYEEAYIDKHCHSNDLTKTLEALVRFNQAIARFMEFAFYHPETLILITADHETGSLAPDENNNLVYGSEEHSSANVPIFVYGYDAELFNGQIIENIQIAHTFAALMGEDNFGDQSVYQSLTKGEK
jgi:alkaline phosphatase